MTTGLAIVGTDTGVGKTVVAAGLLRGLRQRGLNALAFKPVETGLTSDDPSVTGDGDPADWTRLSEETGQRGTDALGCAYALPAAPLVAAQREHRPVPLDRLDRRFQELRRRADLLVVEGAGGLCVPLTEDRLWLDQLVAWRLTALVVARLGLGTINHTLLTLRCLRERGVPVLGLILNTLSEPGPETDSTLSTIVTFTDLNAFDPLPRHTTSSVEVADHLSRTGVMDRVTRWHAQRLLAQTEP